MARLLVFLAATITVWGSVAWVLTESTTADNFTYLIFGVAALMATVIIWAAGFAMTQNEIRLEASRRSDIGQDDAKRKRDTASLKAVISDLSPEQVAALEFALQQRRDTFDEDEQIMANRLSVETDRASSGAH